MRRSLVLASLSTAALALVGSVSCSHKRPAAEFPKLVEDFVYQSLAFSPVTATAQGLHRFNGHDLDLELDDLRFQAVQKQREYYSSIHRMLKEFNRESLSKEDQADADIVDTQCGLALFETDIARTWTRNPTVYVELVGTALFTPYMLHYAPEPDRFRHIIARLRKLPDFLQVAERQLFNVPEVWIKVASEENQGNLDLIDKTLAPACPAELKQEFETAAAPARDALRRFDSFLKGDLRKRVGGRRGNNDGNDDDEKSGGKGPSWRLGASSYAVKFKLALATDRTPDEVLKDAEGRLSQVRAQMLALAQPLHASLFAAHGTHADLSGEALQNKIVAEVLDHIAQNHSTPAGYLDDARKDLDEARNFVKAKHLLTLPSRDNLQVIPTPVFMRGIYAVGGFNPAPTLEPQLGAFYWVTPIPADWPKQRAESKLREYNFYKLKLLTLHEAVPGHYVQGEFANDLQPKPRRILRAIYGNNPYVEGWAQYATQTMLDAGLLDNAPELRLTFLKEELRVIANAIIDIRFQTNRMTEQEALDLMEKQTFQEHEEAIAKVQRAQLSSAQLPTYFVGWRDWLRVREAVQKSRGSAFDLAKFHDRALGEGAVPLPVLTRLLTAK